MIFKIFSALLISLNLLTCFSPSIALAQTETEITVHVFTSKTCPHCAAEKEFLQEYVNQNPQVTVYDYQIDNRQNAEFLNLIAQELETMANGVPFTLIGDQYVVGFDDEQGLGQEIIDLIEQERVQNDGLDLAQIAQNNQLSPRRSEIKPVKTRTSPSPTQPQLEPTQTVTYGPVEPTTLPDSSTGSAKSDNNPKDGSQDDLAKLKQQEINIPLLGKRQIKEFSLPVLTLVVGFIDGFNPCAMWTLMFLISLLLGLEDRKRMWILGVSFILASGAVYFLFMSAWLNLFLFIGFLKWVRLIIGAVALGAGGYYLYDYVVNKTGACKVTMGGTKKKVFDKLKQFTHKQSLLMAVAGIVLLAFAVNLVELVCSAGLPAVYTKILSMSDLSTWKYYFYLAGYIIVFMLDDLFVFFVAMTTLHQVGINSKYSRYSHLIGGILMLFIGLAMWFKPELLTFG
jgi:glutaredoxin